MSSESLHDRLRREAQSRCGYCHTSIEITGQPLTIEHIMPVARGGPSDEDNLWLSCVQCNQFKGVQVEADDPATKLSAKLFNPRHQSWQMHFAWSEDGTTIIGQTPTGRATVVALKLNRPDLVAARRLWVSVGWHPREELF